MISEWLSSQSELACEDVFSDAGRGDGVAGVHFVIWIVAAD